MFFPLIFSFSFFLSLLLFFPSSLSIAGPYLSVSFFSVFLPPSIHHRSESPVIGRRPRRGPGQPRDRPRPPPGDRGRCCRRGSSTSSRGSAPPYRRGGLSSREHGSAPDLWGG
jgi:hypothetical protein